MSATDLECKKLAVLDAALRMSYNAALDCEQDWPQAHRFALGLLGMALTTRARRRRRGGEAGAA